MTTQNNKIEVSYEATIRRLRRAMQKDNRKLSITKHPQNPKFYNVDLNTNIAEEQTLDSLLDEYKILKEWEELGI